MKGIPQRRLLATAVFVLLAVTSGGQVNLTDEQWQCPSQDFSGAKFVDTTPTAAQVYSADGEALGTFEDRHNFTRSVKCGDKQIAIRFRILECSCRRHGQVSFDCVHDNHQRNKLVMSSFHAVLEDTFESETEWATCRNEALTVMWGVFVSDKKGSYIKARGKTAKEYLMGGARAEQRPGVCTPDSMHPEAGQKVCKPVSGGDWAQRKPPQDTTKMAARHTKDSLDVNTDAGRENRKWLEGALEDAAQTYKLEESHGWGSSMTFGKRNNCCEGKTYNLNCGPTSLIGTYPIMWDAAAVNPYTPDTHTCPDHSGTDQCGRMARMYHVGWKPYPAACNISSGIPEGAHLIRLTPCGGEFWNRVVICAVIKVVEAEDSDIMVDPVVQGFGEVAMTSAGRAKKFWANREETFVDECFEKDANSTGALLGEGASNQAVRGRTRPTPRPTPRPAQLSGQKIAELARQKTSTALINTKYEDRGWQRKQICQTLRVLRTFAANADNVIRTAVAGLRFKIAQEKLMQRSERKL